MRPVETSATACDVRSSPPVVWMRNNSACVATEGNPSVRRRKRYVAV